MLKWAVGGHHQARAEPPCCSAIRRAPFKRAKRNNATVDDKENVSRLYFYLKRTGSVKEGLV